MAIEILERAISERWEVCRNANAWLDRLRCIASFGRIEAGRFPAVPLSQIQRDARIGAAFSLRAARCSRASLLASVAISREPN
jgi:hypothetical protein